MWWSILRQSSLNSRYVPFGFWGATFNVLIIYRGHYLSTMYDFLSCHMVILLQCYHYHFPSIFLNYMLSFCGSSGRDVSFLLFFYSIGKQWFAPRLYSLLISWDEIREEIGCDNFLAIYFGSGIFASMASRALILGATKPSVRKHPVIEGHKRWS
jgi:hypothetical protein